METNRDAPSPPSADAFPNRPGGGAGCRWTLAIVLGAPLALILAFFVWSENDLIPRSRGTRARADLQLFATQLKTYRLINGVLPTTEQGLAALVSSPTAGPPPKHWFQLLTQLPKDPWGNDYVYLQPGQRSQLGYDVFSKGADGLPDTKDDIGNW